MSSYVSVLPYVEPYLPGCSRPMMIQMINRIVRQICERTRCWKYSCDQILLEEGTHTYPLFLPDKAEVVRVEYAMYNGRALQPITENQLSEKYGWETYTSSRPTNYMLYPNNELRLWPTPGDIDSSVSNPVTFSVSLRPAITATGVDNDWLLERETELIAHGTLGGLLTIPNREWSEPQTGVLHSQAYEQGLTERVSYYRDQQASPRRVVRYGGI